MYPKVLVLQNLQHNLMKERHVRKVLLLFKCARSKILWILQTGSEAT